MYIENKKKKLKMKVKIAPCNSLQDMILYELQQIFSHSVTSGWRLRWSSSDRPVTGFVINLSVASGCEFREDKKIKIT